MGYFERKMRERTSDKVWKIVRYRKHLINAHKEVKSAIAFMEMIHYERATGLSEEDYCDLYKGTFWREMCRLIKVKNLLKEHIDEEEGRYIAPM